jgi:hypothetical protein
MMALTAQINTVTKEIGARPERRQVGSATAITATAGRRHPATLIAVPIATGGFDASHIQTTADEYYDRRA